MFDDDIVRDILKRAIAAANREGGFDEAMAVQIERQVRKDWGGSEPYISHGTTERRAERNEQIHELYWEEGQKDVKRLAQRFGLSIKQVRRIVGI